MKGVHWLDLGQWPAALALIDGKRAHRQFMAKQCGDHARECAAFPRANCGTTTTLEDQATGKCIIVIAIGKTEDATEKVCTLVHESVHAMRFILEHAAEKSPGTETEAYLTEHIVKQGLKVIA